MKVNDSYLDERHDYVAICTVCKESTLSVMLDAYRHYVIELQAVGLCKCVSWVFTCAVKLMSGRCKCIKLDDSCIF